MSPRRIGWDDAEAADCAPRAGAPRVSNHRAVTPAGEAGEERPEARGPVRQGTEAAAAKLGIDLRSECPVCRSVDGGCSCEEADREFVRRVRHEEDVKAVARCRRCRGPLSVVYVLRPGAGPPPHELSRFSAVWGCAGCSGDALASVALAERGGAARPRS